MANLYPYLISSLPMLSFGAPAQFGLAELIEKCSGLIPCDHLETLRSISIEGPSGSLNPVIRKWSGFNITLKNELVKVRSTRKKARAEDYLRPGGYTEPSLYYLALAAHRNLSLLDGEKILDIARWKFLEELSFGHYFDLDLVIIYAYKLLILERWEKINTADRETLLSLV
ncbi:MAG: DUF2764 family protein [Candidatus Omnitrophota bacterium]|nr:DUF2764 domain-containing protein [Candidatus Omnitrophota bacterium]MBU1929272.1 DUF2764 domain-containing protein [Candidatus Omnitrophota bacterium]MBU2035294.1 DUF2764 domain-containing protein [Candidatus Omnitrophota bacterium]MBU2221424.1 DUF2764 domain-containing protein [Candidatus Omnitrophota bacterium]MBU2258046.1 DUF2764 domain-containing protein [Candidatus Omnitrophota bacterium]